MSTRVCLLTVARFYSISLGKGFFIFANLRRPLKRACSLWAGWTPHRKTKDCSQLCAPCSFGLFGHPTLFWNRLLLCNWTVSRPDPKWRSFVCTTKSSESEQTASLCFRGRHSSARMSPQDNMPEFTRFHGDSLALGHSCSSGWWSRRHAKAQEARRALPERIGRGENTVLYTIEFLVQHFNWCSQ